MRNLQHFYLPAISTCYKQRSPGSTPGLLRSDQGFDDRCNPKETQRHVHPDFDSDPRFHVNDPSGHAGAARKGCVQRPVERISRRSQVHRPSIGWLAQPLEALCRVPGSPLPARLRRRRRRPGHRLRLRPASCPHCDCGLTRGSQSDYAGAVPPRSRVRQSV